MNILLFYVNLGRLFKTAELGYMIDSLIMFHVDHPCDWIIENVLYSKVCSVGVSKVRIRSPFIINYLTFKQYIVILYTF